MTNDEERMQILKMVANKQITAEDAARLLEALRTPSNETSRGTAAQPRWLRVRVTDRRSGRVKVNVNLPVGLLDVGLKMGARFAPEMGGLDLNAIQAAVKQGMQGRILEVDDEEDSERVEIYVE